MEARKTLPVTAFPTTAPLALSGSCPIKIKSTFMPNRRPKHVIFLGAGASATSGYPMAAGLRMQWLASSTGLLTSVQKLFGDSFHNQSNLNAYNQLNEWLKQYQESLKLFREGGFGTIDEFCYLMRDSQPKTVRDLKKVLRLVLGFQNPEAYFAKSDYYQFIQNLFEPENLRELRKDVVVLSYNYDPYLEWLLRRAIQTRNSALAQNSGNNRSSNVEAEYAVCSGFLGGRAGVESLKTGDGFCVLKLHGIIAWPASEPSGGNSFKRYCSFGDLFETPLDEKLKTLTGPVSGGSDAPIVFPWEIMDQTGNPLAESQFLLKERSTHNLNGDNYFAGARTGADPNVYRILEAVWARAQEEVQAASRISFVGLSMHSYLNPGFQFLFRGKQGKIRLAITDSDTADARKAVGRHVPLHELSPTARIIKLRDSVCQGMQWNQEFVYRNFEEFIAKELPI